MSIPLRFVSGGSWDSHLIRYTTRCRWSHVEVLSEDSTETFGAQLHGGVRWRSTEDSCYKSALAYQTVQVQCTEAQSTAFFNFLKLQEFKPYDWRAIVSFTLGERDWRAADAWFCSELDVRGFEIAEILTLPSDIPVTRINPRDLWCALAGKNRDLLSLHSAKILPVNPTDFGPVVIP